MRLIGRRNFLAGLKLGAGACLLAPMFRQLLPEAEAIRERHRMLRGSHVLPMRLNQELDELGGTRCFTKVWDGRGWNRFMGWGHANLPVRATLDGFPPGRDVLRHGRTLSRARCRGACQTKAPSPRIAQLFRVVQGVVMASGLKPQRVGEVRDCVLRFRALAQDVLHGGRTPHRSVARALAGTFPLPPSEQEAAGVPSDFSFRPLGPARPACTP